MKMSEVELLTYRDELQYHVNLRLEKLKRAHIHNSPAQIGLRKREENQIKLTKNLNDLRSDVYYFKKWLTEDKTSTVRGFESFKRNSLRGLGINIRMSNETFDIVMKAIDKIRELRPDLAKGTDRFRYRAVFDRINFFEGDLTEDNVVQHVLQTLQDAIEEDKKRKAREKREERTQLSKIILNNVEEQPTNNPLWGNIRAYYDKLFGRNEMDR